MKARNWLFAEPTTDESWIVCPTCNVMQPIQCWKHYTPNPLEIICPNCFQRFDSRGDKHQFDGRVQCVAARQAR